MLSFRRDLLVYAIGAFHIFQIAIESGWDQKQIDEELDDLIRDKRVWDDLTEDFAPIKALHSNIPSILAYVRFLANNETTKSKSLTMPHVKKRGNRVKI